MRHHRTSETKGHGGKDPRVYLASFHLYKQSQYRPKYLLSLGTTQSNLEPVSYNAVCGVPELGAGDS